MIGDRAGDSDGVEVGGVGCTGAIVIGSGE